MIRTLAVRTCCLHAAAVPCASTPQSRLASGIIHTISRNMRTVAARAIQLKELDENGCSILVAEGDPHDSFLERHAVTVHTTLLPGPAVRKRSPGEKCEVSFLCPACGGNFVHVDRARTHIDACCPDLLVGTAWERLASGKSAGPRTADDTLAILQQGALTERHNWYRVLHLAFRSGQQEYRGGSVARPEKELAELMGVPVGRVRGMLKRAIRAWPMVSDPIPVEVLFEDEWIVAVNKPPGIATSPRHRHEGGALHNRVHHHIGRPPFVVHRLDMNTSGVLVFAKSSEAAAMLSEEFRERRPVKEYLAICQGAAWDQKEMLVDAPIGDHDGLKEARKVREDGKPATTAVRVIGTSPSEVLSERGVPAAFMEEEWRSPERVSGASLVSCLPKTGRTHQIRLHLAHVGHPIVGDDIYGMVGPFMPRQALHAHRITVRHPGTKEELTITAPPPEDMRACAAELGLEGIFKVL